MTSQFHRSELGAGIFTVPDVSFILGLPLPKVRRYIKDYGDVKFGQKLFHENYSWFEGTTRAVNFYALIEMYVFFYLREKLGLSVHKINSAREEIAKAMETPYPFANHAVLADRKGILYHTGTNLVNADKSQQVNLEEIVTPFLKKIEFDRVSKRALRYWPLGKDTQIVVDPRRQFGQPTIEGTNICAETIERMYSAGESRGNIVRLFDVTENQIDDVLRLYQLAA
jgi:uncharacterized protein (DUF433 family)